ncbi:hypothetical protein [Symmachiella dynata]|uniref:leucine-rich repeat domain-containing protein n=1 Tax=Symmachiella dynata TaxID=2527995 RepID=UPI0030EBAC2B
MTETTNKKRLPRTGTLMLIAVVLLVGGGVLMVWLPYHRNQVAMAEVQKLRGVTEPGIVRPFWIPDAVDDEYLELFLRGTGVWLSDTQVSDAGLKYLHGLTNLRELDLRNTQVTDAGLEQLRGLTKLVELSLAMTQVSDEGFQKLRGLTKLRYLDLRNTQVGDEGLAHLPGATKLENLWLDDTQVSDAGVDHLRGLTNLQLLTLHNTQVTRAGIERLQKALPDCEIYWTPPAE